eukprot:gene13414-14789_t
MLSFGEQFKLYKDLNATISFDQLEEAQVQEIATIPDNNNDIDLATTVTLTMQPQNEDQDTKSSPNPTHQDDSDEDHQQHTPKVIPSKRSPTSAMDTNA